MGEVRRTTSRVFEVSRALRRTLLAQPWPTHPYTGQEPGVGMSDLDWSEYGEQILIAPKIEEDDQTITPHSNPGIRREHFRMHVLCQVMAGSAFQDEDELIARLEALSDIVQRCVWEDRDTNPGARYRDLIPNNRLIELSPVDAVTFQTEFTDRGYIGGSRITLDFMASI